MYSIGCAPALSSPLRKGQEVSGTGGWITVGEIANAIPVITGTPPERPRFQIMKTRRTTITLPETLLAKLEQEAKERMTSLSQVIRESLAKREQDK